MLSILITSLTFRIRGGLRIPFTDKKFPLNKWWFPAWFACLACILKEYNATFFLIMTLATYVSSSCFGWGEYCGCVTGVGKVNPNRSDCAAIDEFVDNLQITIKGKVYKLTDFPVLFGWVGLSLRGIISTFIIGLALNNLLFIPCGVMMGTFYWLAGLFARKILKKTDKTGWNLGEFLYGGYLAFCLILCV